MQNACMGALLELADRDPDILYLTSDSGDGGLDVIFRRNFPDRSFDFGIAEQEMIGAAAGMALLGKKPFIYGASPFLVYRGMEFIRNDVCLQRANVKFLATGSGVSVSTLGPTHHTTEDIAILRALPGMVIMSPSTGIQARAAVLKAHSINGPVYIRLGMECKVEFYNESYEINASGMDDLFCGGEDGIVFSSGNILKEVERAVYQLREEGLDMGLVNVLKLKPFDRETFVSRISNAKRIFSVEEHVLEGGLGSILSDAIAERRVDVRIYKIGLRNCFAVGYGTYDEVLKQNGLDREHIAKLIRKEVL
jgi:Transketolase, C-terminal subunit